MAPAKKFLARDLARDRNDDQAALAGESTFRRKLFEEISDPRENRSVPVVSSRRFDFGKG